MVHPTAVIYPNVIIEDNVSIGAYCIIGAPAESLKYWRKESEYSVVIKSGTIITGLCTIDAGTEQDTIISNNCFIMKQTHIGHDSFIDHNVIIAPHVSVGGHCIISANCNLGMNSVIHQRVTVPSKSMIGMGAVVTKSSQTWANGVYVGNPAYFLRWNNRK